MMFDLHRGLVHIDDPVGGLEEVPVTITVDCEILVS